MPDPRRSAAAGWHPGDAHTALAFLASHIKRQGTDDIAWWELHRALRPDPAGPLSGPVAGAVIGLGAGCTAAEYFHWILSPLARSGCFPAVTLATALAATATIRLARVPDTTGQAGASPGPGPAPRDRRPPRPLAQTGRRLATGCAVVLPLSAGVGAVTEHWARTVARAPRGFPVGVAPYTGLKAAAAWTLFFALLAPGVLGLSLLRRRGGRPARHVGRGPARVRRVLAFFLLFWLGAQLSGSLAFLSIRQVTGRPPAEVTLMDPAGGSPRPTPLDFRAPRRLPSRLRRTWRTAPTRPSTPSAARC
ncbi:hypothetical protein [Streptomyces sp. JB150]|uniref:hypothetical protein n=1 Tax=Streptomyces sp. JB150 TaxID=2714844 RepID=UPI001F10ECBD|nr:hypothetical protein [Streptomyces sp. JB150]